MILLLTGTELFLFLLPSRYVYVFCGVTWLAALLTIIAVGVNPIQLWGGLWVLYMAIASIGKLHNWTH